MKPCALKESTFNLQWGGASPIGYIERAYRATGPFDIGALQISSLERNSDVAGSSCNSS